MNFYENFLQLCIKAGKSKSACLLEMGFSKSSDKRWAEGNLPTNASLIKIANYFGVSTDMLLYGDCGGSAKRKPVIEETMNSDVIRLKIIEAVLKLNDSDLNVVLTLVSRMAVNSPSEED